MSEEPVCCICNLPLSISKKDLHFVSFFRGCNVQFDFSWMTKKCIVSDTKAYTDVEIEQNNTTAEGEYIVNLNPKTQAALEIRAFCDHLVRDENFMVLDYLSQVVAHKICGVNRNNSHYIQWKKQFSNKLPADFSYHDFVFNILEFITDIDADFIGFPDMTLDQYNKELKRIKSIPVNNLSVEDEELLLKEELVNQVQAFEIKNGRCDILNSILQGPKIVANGGFGENIYRLLKKYSKLVL